MAFDDDAGVGVVGDEALDLGDRGVVGAVVGLGLAALMTRFAPSLLFGVSPLDVGVFALIAVAALAVAGLASWVPARRASGVDPVEALRHE